MTREEAIEYIKSRCIGSTEERDGTQWSEAMWMAIEALAERPTESDFISKAKVLETYSELYWFDIDCGVVSKAEVDKIYERLQSLPSADRPTGEWIPVRERLPENSGCVLISIAGDIEFGAYDKQNSDWAIWRDGYWDEGKRADAWMPLPEPYREDGEE